MNAQLPTALTRFAVSRMTMMGRTTSIACRYRRNTVKASNGGTDHMSVARYGCRSAITAG